MITNYQGGNMGKFIVTEGDGTQHDVTAIYYEHNDGYFHFFRLVNGDYSKVASHPASGGARVVRADDE